MGGNVDTKILLQSAKFKLKNVHLSLCHLKDLRWKKGTKKGTKYWTTLCWPTPPLGKGFSFGHKIKSVFWGIDKFDRKKQNLNLCWRNPFWKWVFNLLISSHFLRKTASGAETYPRSNKDQFWHRWALLGTRKSAPKN